MHAYLSCQYASVYCALGETLSTRTTTAHNSNSRHITQSKKKLWCNMSQQHTAALVSLPVAFTLCAAFASWLTFASMRGKAIARKRFQSPFLAQRQATCLHVHSLLMAATAVHGGVNSCGTDSTLTPASASGSTSVVHTVTNEITCDGKREPQALLETGVQTDKDTDTIVGSETSLESTLDSTNKTQDDEQNFDALRTTEPCVVDISEFEDVAEPAACETFMTCIRDMMEQYTNGSSDCHIRFVTNAAVRDSTTGVSKKSTYCLKIIRVDSGRCGALDVSECRNCNCAPLFELRVPVRDEELRDERNHETLVVSRIMPRLIRLIPCRSSAACASIVRVIRGFFKPTATDCDPLFVDVLPLLSNPRAFTWLLDEGEQFVKNVQADRTHTGSPLCCSHGVTAVVALETRGFMFGASLANRLGVSFVPLRRSGTYPSRLVIRQEFTNVSGCESIELDGCILGEHEHVVLVDDLLASGASLLAASSLLRAADVHVCGAFVPVEIESKRGRHNLWKYEAHWALHSVVRIDNLKSAPRIENIRDAITLVEGKSGGVRL